MNPPHSSQGIIAYCERQITGVSNYILCTFFFFLSFVFINFFVSNKGKQRHKTKMVKMTHFNITYTLDVIVCYFRGELVYKASSHPFYLHALLLMDRKTRTDSTRQSVHYNQAVSKQLTLVSAHTKGSIYFKYWPLNIHHNSTFTLVL